MIKLSKKILILIFSVLMLFSCNNINNDKKVEKELNSKKVKIDFYDLSKDEKEKIKKEMVDFSFKILNEKLETEKFNIFIKKHYLKKIKNNSLFIEYLQKNNISYKDLLEKKDLSDNEKKGLDIIFKKILGKEENKMENLIGLFYMDEFIKYFPNIDLTKFLDYQLIPVGNNYENIELDINLPKEMSKGENFYDFIIELNSIKFEN